MECFPIFLPSGTLSESSPLDPEKGPDFGSALQAEPSVTGSDFGMDHFGGILVNFQAGELVSPATKLYIQFDQVTCHDPEWIMTVPPPLRAKPMEAQRGRHEQKALGHE